MADFQAHINQAKKNLTILSETSQKIKNSWDWQVTMAYYAAVHLMNAHLAIKVNLHFKTHKDVKIALFKAGWPCKLPDDIYTSYIILENLSRRSRYLCHEDETVNNETEFKTFDKHLKRALSHLDQILEYFKKEYNLTINRIDIDCIELRSIQLKNFSYLQKEKP